jgi:hypothetical protein
VTRQTTVCAALLFVSSLTAASQTTAAQSAASSHITLVPMSNMSKPGDLDFEGGGCDIDGSTAAMTCSFQQVLLTPVREDPATCLITTNRYEQTFRKQDARHWTSTDAPEGPCGIVATTTLQQEANSLAVLWRVTMSMRKIATNNRGAAPCGSVDETPEVLASTDARRPISCTFVRGSSLGF